MQNLPKKKPKNRRPIEAEQAVLGTLMLDHRAWDRIADRLVESDFYRQDHRLIFNILQYLSERGQPLDVLTVSKVLKQQQKIEAAGGETYLFELTKNMPTAANIVAYADIVRERTISRRKEQKQTWAEIFPRYKLLATKNRRRDNTLEETHDRATTTHNQPVEHKKITSTN